MSKYTVSFQSVDFGRRIEMALFDAEKRRFVVPNFDYVEQGRAFMAGRPEEFHDFINALLTGWREFLADQANAAQAVTQYTESFIEGFDDGRGPPDQGSLFE